MAFTISLAAFPDGNYWINVTDEETGKPAFSSFGPFPREQVFHRLLKLGMTDDPADKLILEAELGNTAEVHGIRPKDGERY